MPVTHGNGVQADGHPLMTGHWDNAKRFQLPADCRRILIVGAGGFGREVLQWARDAWPDQASRIEGFLSDDPDRLDGFSTDVGVVGAAKGYRPGAGEYVLLGIGVPYSRRRVAEDLCSRGARFLTLVHPRSLVSSSAGLGEGSIVCPFAVISDSATLGRFVLVNYHASLGHDSAAGDYAVLSPYATLGGGACVDHDVFLGLHASVGPGVTVGPKSKVSANSCALVATPPHSLVYGVPGRVVKHIKLG